VAEVASLEVSQYLVGLDPLKNYNMMKVEGSKTSNNDVRP
jgi:hypothetical protein